MISIEELSNQLSDIEIQLKELSDKKYLLQQKIKLADETNLRKEISSWELSFDSHLVMFANNDSSFYSVVTISSINIDKESMFISCVVGYYTHIQDELSYRITKEILHYSTLLDYMNNYAIYVFDKVQFALIQQLLCEMKVDHKNIYNVQSVFVKHADKIIS